MLYGLPVSHKTVIAMAADAGLLRLMLYLPLLTQGIFTG